MEFKDKLKELRTKKGLTQSELAKAIFVSRSAVAKWENGLGLPSEESMEALQTYLGVSPAYFATEEPEAVIVEKNRKISQLSKVLITIVWIILALDLTVCILWYLGYRFTSASAVHESYHPYPVIRTDDYDFYMNDNQAPRSIRAVKKYGLLYKRVEGTMKELETTDGENVGALFCYEGKTRNHYFIMVNGYIVDGGHTEDGKVYATVEYPYRTTEIHLNKKLVQLDFYTYFSLEGPIHSLAIKGKEIVILDMET